MSFSGDTQRISLPSSFFSLAFGYLKLYCYLRLGRYQDVNPSWKIICLMLPIFILQLASLLVPIVVIAAYFREWMVFYISAHIIVTGLTTFCFLHRHMGLENYVEKHYKKRFTDKITEQDREKGLTEAWKIFYVACGTAWIAPAAVWDKDSKFILVTCLIRKQMLLLLRSVWKCSKLWI